MLTTRARLDRLYQDKTIDVTEMRRRKLAIFGQLHTEYLEIRQHWRGDSRYDRAFAKPWNNALISTNGTPLLQLRVARGGHCQ